MCPASSVPAIRKYACCQAKRVSSRRSKNFRLYRPRPKWKREAPCITVLSRSKKAAARSSPATGNSGSAGFSSAGVTSVAPASSASSGACEVLRAASALASPASTLRAVAGRLRGVSHSQERRILSGFRPDLPSGVGRGMSRA